MLETLSLYVEKEHSSLSPTLILTSPPLRFSLKSNTRTLSGMPDESISAAKHHFSPLFPQNTEVRPSNAFPVFGFAIQDKSCLLSTLLTETFLKLLMLTMHWKDHNPSTILDLLALSLGNSTAVLAAGHSVGLGLQVSMNLAL